MSAHIDGMSTNGPAVQQFGEKLKDMILTGNKPTDAEIRAEIIAAGLTIATSVTIHVHQNTSNELHIALPSKEQLESILAKISAGNYTLNPNFEAFVSKTNPSEDETLDFYDFRLGDYALQHCD